LDTSEKGSGPLGESPSPVDRSPLLCRKISVQFSLFLCALWHIKHTILYIYIMKHKCKVNNKYLSIWFSIHIEYIWCKSIKYNIGFFVRVLWRKTQCRLWTQKQYCMKLKNKCFRVWVIDFLSYFLCFSS
jgi:hypothetical protein